MEECKTFIYLSYCDFRCRQCVRKMHEIPGNLTYSVANDKKNEMRPKKNFKQKSKIIIGSKIKAQATNFQASKTIVYLQF